ncbi:MAG TPA: polysaccharide biosynthesis C-terminal domain-containing protein [Bacteroidales bacterium]|nr:polysaccharide biosynthesis C-terminal domain-containing protein [Bacteroidales bacterium]
MSAIRKLAGQTAIYGIPLILGRILGYLLVPLYTRVFLPGEYGTVNVFYSYAAFLLVVLTYGMETAFFRFNQLEKDREKVFSTAMLSLVITSSVFIILISAFARPVASAIDYAGHKEYVIWFGWILTLDALASVPFARLRALNKPSRFATIKMTGIALNIGLNLFFILLCPWIIGKNGTLSGFVKLFYRADWGIEYIFISNLASSAIVLLMLLPEIISATWKIHPGLWKRMFIYAFPLLFAGMAGIVNETFDRLLLRYLLPDNIAEYQVGIYSACYKISILMTIFIQAFRYAAEPFFFAQAKQSDSRDVYAEVMNYFIITVSLIFLGTMLYLDDFVMPLLIGEEYRVGKNVIPVLMLANLFLGVYYNLSVWYKLTGQTVWGAWFSVIGAVITLILNFWWIPLSPDHFFHGYYGSAWATFICYASMMVISYIVGQKYFHIRYNIPKILGYLGSAVLLYFLTVLVRIDNRILSIAFHTLLLIIFCAGVITVEKPDLKKLLSAFRFAKS